MNKKRIYNIFFHLHTVSGIVISCVLFILFFAGAFTMFKEEIKIWERKQPSQHISLYEMDFDKVLNLLNKEYNLSGRTINFYSLGDTNSVRVFVDHSHAAEASGEDLKTEILNLNLEDYSLKTYEKAYSYSEFLYQLHFLDHIPAIGIYIAGFVSLFFLFALLTGVYIHWDKIVKNFVLFRPMAKWKTVWTDAHTVLGTIAFPFQLIFAITGAYFCLSILILLPAYSLYDNDAEKLLQDLRPERTHAPWQEITHQQPSSINTFIKEYKDYFHDFDIQQVSVENIDGSNMAYHIVGELDPDYHFNSLGGLVVDAYRLDILEEINPSETPYKSEIQKLLVKLHFGKFGGILNKIIYTILAFITCFIILSGVMIWFTARNKKNKNPKQRNFHYQVTHIYLAICMGMLPMTALGFIWARLLPILGFEGQSIYYTSFYYAIWLLLALYFIFKKNMQYTNQGNLMLGGTFFLLVPMADIWVSYLYENTKHLEIFSLINILCFVIGISCLFAYQKVKQNQRLKLSKV
ncbi:PepSY domain-containing protein [Flavobacteriaceae bacterium Ap0902]|nr:PepSY domain-containing protein [Flavobacteriaceae bacterium Ap0902]